MDPITTAQVLPRGLKLIRGEARPPLLPASQTGRDPISIPNKTAVPGGRDRTGRSEAGHRAAPGFPAERGRAAPSAALRRPPPRGQPTPAPRPAAFCRSRFGPPSTPGCRVSGPFSSLALPRKGEDGDESSGTAHRVHGVLQLREPIRHVSLLSERKAAAAGTRLGSARVRRGQSQGRVLGRGGAEHNLTGRTWLRLIAHIT